MWRAAVLCVAASALAGCSGYVDRYEKAVYDWEPTYCYKSIGAVECYRKPYFRDSAQLVNYYGPHPSRYDPPPAPKLYPQAAPKMIDHWVKDPEPKVAPAKPTTYADVFPAEFALRPLGPGETTPGTAAFLRHIEENLAAVATTPKVDPPSAEAAAATQPAPDAVPTTGVAIAPDN